jgi:hypothetical protein
MSLTPQADKTSLRQDPSAFNGDNPVKWQSITGVEIIAGFKFNDEYYDAGVEPPSVTFRVFGEIQTISISSTRSVYPVRCLGESSVRAYTRGARTFAGTIIFTMFDKDPFEEVIRLSSENEIYGREPFFIDQIPEFDIVINAVNEFGMVSKALIGSVTLSNYGTTLSIHDIYTEISYSYVARFYIPMTADTKAFDRVRKLMTDIPALPASKLATQQVSSARNNTAEEDLARKMQNKYEPGTSTGKFIREYKT